MKEFGSHVTQEVYICILGFPDSKWCDNMPILSNCCGNVQASHRSQRFHSFVVVHLYIHGDTKCFVEVTKAYRLLRNILTIYSNNGTPCADLRGIPKLWKLGGLDLKSCSLSHLPQCAESHLFLCFAKLLAFSSTATMQQHVCTGCWTNERLPDCIALSHNIPVIFD